MYNFPYKLFAQDVIKELSKSDDEEIIYKFVKELCKLSKLKQYEKYKTPKVVKEKWYMTDETLEKAYKLNSDIKNCKNILKAMNSPFVNIIRLNDFEGERDTSQIITLSSEPELEMYVREYFIHKLEILEQEFAKVN